MFIIMCPWRSGTLQQTLTIIYSANNGDILFSSILSWVIMAARTKNPVIELNLLVVCAKPLIKPTVAYHKLDPWEQMKHEYE